MYQEQTNSIKSQLAAPFSVVMQKPGRGGETFQYIRTVDIVKRVLDVRGLEYSFEIVSANRDGDYVIIQGRLSHYEGDKLYVKDQFGSAQVKYKRGTNEPLDLGNDYKAAASDAFKKCATLWGVALDLYDPSSATATDAQRSEIFAIFEAHGTTLPADLHARVEQMTAEEADALLLQLRAAPLPQRQGLSI